MANSGAHYEQAFESFLTRTQAQWHRINQTRKAASSSGPLKSFDYLIHPANSPTLLIDVKGRRHTARLYQQGKLGQNWVTQDDLDGLTAWQSGFPETVIALFVFTYWIYDLPRPQSFPTPLEPPSPLLFYHNGNFYSFIAVPLDDYRRHMKQRSPRWQTIFIPSAHFEAIARPFHPSR